ncbi:MAG: LON peptidase substrate-binding domain-containing protein [Pseudomonadales bacterium]
MQSAPIFPLNAVLFPGTRLPLKIFEQRYLELVKQCLRQDAEFVVVLISKGQEVGVIPEIFSVGTTARIVDWSQLEGGILGITVEGVERVSIAGAEGAVGEVMQGDVAFFDDQVPLEQTHDDELVGLLRKLEQHPLVQSQGMTVDYDDLVSVMWGLAGLLPIELEKKQQLLEADDAQQRYQLLHRMLQSLEG